jgi:C-terminal processing protease CtpA/Prc
MLNRSDFIASLFAASAGVRIGAGLLGTRPALQPSLLRHDLDQLWNTMLAVGVYPFATSDRGAVTKRYRATRNTLTNPLDALSFVLKISPIFGALNDGHVGVQPDAAFMDALAVPVRCTPVDRDLIVLASADDVIEPGSTLLTLAGIAADRIRDVTLAGWGGQTARLRIERFASASRIVSSILANDPAHYDVRWRTTAGTERRATLPRAQVPMPWARGNGVPYAFRTAADGSIAMIDYRQCIGLSSFRTFLQRVFSEVRSARMRAVIVDIRNNSGGDSELNDELWQYLTAKTFTQFGPVVMRSSDYLKQRYGKSRYVEIYGPEAWDAPNGTLITYPQSKIGFIHPRDNALRFRGPVALLIGPRTFSSALDCAIAAKNYGLATLIGEETSEPVNTTGEVIKIGTRFSGITGSFTTKYYRPPKPAAPGSGVIPDIEVRTTLDDTIAGRDPVLARAIHELRVRFR